MKMASDQLLFRRTRFGRRLVCVLYHFQILVTALRHKGGLESDLFTYHVDAE